MFGRNHSTKFDISQIFRQFVVFGSIGKRGVEILACTDLPDHAVPR